jgi:hypothetical protein
MNRRLGWLAACVVVAGVGSAATADEPLDVVKKAIKANGGKEALEKYQAATLKGAGTVNVNGMELKYNATWYYGFPANYRVELETDINGTAVKIVQVANGKQGWQKVGDTETMDLPKHEFENVKAMIAAQMVGSLVPLLDTKKYTVGPLGDVKVNGKKAIGLNVMNKSGVDVNLYFDPKTLMLIKQQYQAKDPTGKEVTQSLYLSGFKKINGVPMPMKILIHHDDKKFVTAEFSAIKLSKSLDAGLFKKP